MKPRTWRKFKLTKTDKSLKDYYGFKEEAIVELRQRENKTKKFTIIELEELILSYKQKLTTLQESNSPD